MRAGQDAQWNGPARASEPAAEPAAAARREHSPDRQPRRAEHEQGRRNHLQEQVLDHVCRERAVGEPVQRRLGRDDERDEPGVERLRPPPALAATATAAEPAAAELVEDCRCEREHEHAWIHARACLNGRR